MANEKTYPNYLMHYRTKGSKNGISTTKGYTAVGQKARGHWVNGHYVYYEDEAKQRAFRQGLAESRGRNSAYENQAMVKRMENSRKADVLDQKIYGKNIKGYTRLADISPYEKQRRANKYLSNSPQHQAAVNQHNAEVAGREAALAYAQNKRKRTNTGASQAADAARMNAEARNRILGSSKGSLEKGASDNWQQQANMAASGKPSGYNNAHYSAVSQAAAERKAREAALKQQKKASLRNAAAKGANNNWQQRANKEAGKGLAYDKTTTHSSYINARGERTYTTDKPKKWEDEREARWKRTDAAKAESQLRNSRSDIGNAFADLKEDAKNTFKALKSKIKKKKK